MKELFLDYEMSLKLKEIGFNGKCVKGFDKNGNDLYYPDSDIIVDNPLIVQVFKWFRDEHGIYGNVLSNLERYDTFDIDGHFQDEIIEFVHFYRIVWLNDSGSKDYIRETKDFETVNYYEEYEDAELNCIKQMVKLVEDVRK